MVMVIKIKLNFLSTMLYYKKKLLLTIEKNKNWF